MVDLDRSKTWQFSRHQSHHQSVCVGDPADELNKRLRNIIIYLLNVQCSADRGAQFDYKKLVESVSVIGASNI